MKMTPYIIAFVLGVLLVGTGVHAADRQLSVASLTSTYTAQMAIYNANIVASTTEINAQKVACAKAREECDFSMPDPEDTLSAQELTNTYQFLLSAMQ
jgi:outer membrane murein-binding lipoprotein Lpp